MTDRLSLTYSRTHALTNAPCRYITVLVEMTQFEGTRHGKLIASEILNVTIRVKDVRPFSVRQMVSDW